MLQLHLFCLICTYVYGASLNNSLVLFCQYCTIAPTRVEFLFQLLPGIGALFRVITPHGSVPLRIASRSCEGETQNHGSTCLLGITMSFKFSLVLRV